MPETGTEITVDFGELHSPFRKHEEKQTCGRITFVILLSQKFTTRRSVLGVWKQRDVHTHRSVHQFRFLARIINSLLRLLRDTTFYDVRPPLLPLLYYNSVHHTYMYIQYIYLCRVHLDMWKVSTTMELILETACDLSSARSNSYHERAARRDELTHSCCEKIKRSTI